MNQSRAIKIIAMLSFTAFVLVMLAMCTGCNKVLQNSITSNSVSRQHDSTSTTVRLRIDTVLVPGDSVTIEVPVPVRCPDNDLPIFFDQEVQTGSKRSSMVAKFKDGKLTIKGKCHELEQLVYMQDSSIRQYKSTIDSISHKTVQVQQVRYVPGAYKWAMGFTVSFFIILFLFIAYKIFKLTPYGKAIPF
jgi:hypothetical protein